MVEGREPSAKPSGLEMERAFAMARDSVERGKSEVARRERTEAGESAEAKEARLQAARDEIRRRGI